jgi:Mrp family chromosome partitioning ATPase
VEGLSPLPNQEEVLKALDSVMDPELGISITSLGMVKKVELQAETASIQIALTIEGCPLKDTLQKDVNKAIAPLGFRKVNVFFSTMAPQELEALKQRLGAERASKINSYGKPGQEGPKDHGGINRLPKKAAKLIAISSGKGGVGKSSVTAQIAVAMARAGKKVGILDADITGPSIARIFGIRERPRLEGQDTLIPVPSAAGVGILSMNLLVSDEKAPVIWRGPLINGAIRQLYANAAWEGYDVLLVDMPPGTSDATLTVFQSLPLDGCVIVSTPQALVGMIVAKSIGMAKMLRIPILGLIENLAFVELPDSGKPYYLFGALKGEAEAKAQGIPYLGAVPINPALATACDEGQIQAVNTPLFDDLARRLLAAAEPAKK